MAFTDTLMTDRRRFHAIMNYQPADRGFLQDFQAWEETEDVWHAYGLPADVRAFGKSGSEPWARFWGFDRFWASLGGNVMLCPGIEPKVLKDEGRTEIVRQGDGAIVRRHKYGSSIPAHIDHLLKDRASWDEHFRWRLDPDHPDRLPGDLRQRLAAEAQRDYPLATFVGSMFGQLRNWMGLEGVTYIQADDPRLFEEMILTIGDCIVGTLGRVLAEADAAGVTFDLAMMWEDMSCGMGPLLSRAAFDRLLAPQYKRITGLLREHGCDLVMLDSDGDVRQLLPGWLQAGVNITFPLEVGTWGQDPLAVREQFGPELRICGGFDKHILARCPDDISREIERLAPLVEAGGFIPFCDHRVPPDVPLGNYVHYVRTAREIWGRNLPNLRPMGELDPGAPRIGQPYEYQSFLIGPARH